MNLVSRLLAALRLRLWARLWPARVERGIDEELRTHVHLHAEELIAEGVPVAEAWRRARRSLRDPNRIRADCRRESMLPEPGHSRIGPIDMIALDLRLALRTLLRRPGFTLVAAATLALGIAVTTTMFSLVHGIVLSPLPFPEPDRLVSLHATIRDDGNRTISVAYPEYLEWRRQTEVFEGVAVLTGSGRDLTGDGEPERATGFLVSPEYFDVLGARPILGRTLTSADYADGEQRVVVLGRGLWQRRFAADPGIVGRQVRLNDEPHRVVGVLDEESVWPPGGQMWLPLAFPEPMPDWVMDWDNFWLRAVGRLQPGVSVEQAGATIEGIAGRLAAEMPALRGNVGAAAFSLRERIVGPQMRATLLVLLGAVGFVLLIACFNVANLLLARGTERRREVAVRRALGASRGDLLRQTLAESLLLALLGGALGLLAAAALSRLVVSILPPAIPRLHEVGIDGGVLLFTGLLSLATALLVGAVPALQLGRGRLTEALNESSRGAAGGVRTQRSRSALVVAEVTLSLVLLVGAGLMLRSLQGLLERDAGFDLDNGLAVWVGLPATRYPDDAAVDRFFLEVGERIAGIRGVRSVAAAMTVPLTGVNLERVHLEEGAPEPPDGPEFGAAWNVVTPGFFRTAGIPVLVGRGFSREDTAETEPVMIVSESFARTMFPEGDVLGRRVRSWRDENVLRAIVGVAGDVRMGGMDAEHQPVVYVSTLQAPQRPSAFLVRTEVEPLSVAAAVRDVVWGDDSLLPVSEILTLRALAARSVAGPQAVGHLLGLFAALALALAATGLYGVVAYSVAQRQREYGIRMALGARDRDVMKAVLRQALGLSSVGLLLGLGLAVALTRALGSLLGEVHPADAMTYAAVCGVILATTLLASLVPARRATRVDPAQSLRAD